MYKFRLRRMHVASVLALACCFVMQQPVGATPFGQGVFGADNPFGSLTSLSLSLSGNVNISMTPSGGNYEGSASGTATVTTNDANGYRLWVYSPTSTDMVHTAGGGSIPASGNSSPAALATNTWGYNTTGSTTNFTGMLTTPAMIKEVDGPYTSGDDTTVTFGAKADITKSAGTYSVNIVYTAAPRFE